MKYIQTSIKVLLVALATAMWLPIANAAPAYTMKISHAAGPGDPRDIGANKVADVLNSATDCNFKVRVYPASQLGPSNMMIQQMQIGAVEAVILPFSFLQGFAPLMGVMDIPYLFPTDARKMWKVEHSDAMRNLMSKTTDDGFVTLGAWFMGFKNWTGPIQMNTPEALKGMRVRVMPSKILVKQNQLWGMENVSMPFGQTYSALANGTIDGEDNPITTIHSMKFYEVQDYMTMTKHGVLDQAFMVSKKWWDTLPANCQADVRQAVKAGGKVAFNATLKQIKVDLKDFKGYMKVVPMTDEQRAALAKIVEQVRDYYVKLTGAEGKKILNAFEAEVAKLKDNK